MQTAQKQDRKKVTYSLAVSVFAVGAIVLVASGAPAWLAGASLVIALVLGWLAIAAVAPLTRKQTTFALAALVFALAGAVMYGPGSTFMAGALVFVGVMLFWVALNSKD